jgi:hypothetical protein
VNNKTTNGDLERNKAVVKKIVEIFAGGDISEINSVDRETIDITTFAH